MKKRTLLKGLITAIVFLFELLPIPFGEFLATPFNGMAMLIFGRRFGALLVLMVNIMVWLDPTVYSTVLGTLGMLSILPSYLMHFLMILAFTLSFLLIYVFTYGAYQGFRRLPRLVRMIEGMR